MIKKVLIANRGEIAIRIIRACHDLGLQTVAVYSQADQEALHVLNADEAICIGEPHSQKSYLKIANILSACEITHADAIHPGYGFLAENANFASICKSCGLNFIGPSHEAISMLGDKAKAKALAKKNKVPVIPGSNGVIENVQEGIKETKRIGFPIFIKAVGGGGGKGIRIAHDLEEFVRQFSAARAEADACFNNPDVYLEKMVLNPRHIEVQILGDKHGNYVHLFERDCTIQRRRQKLIEEAPSPVINESLRRKLGEAALAIAKSVGYYSLGTVEFLLDQDKNFYFMEVNTRIQVEHTVTEELTGVDLVVEQIKVAMGKKLKIRQKDVTLRGHAVQFRINAEDPRKNFSPSPGMIEYYTPPGGPHVRIDTACYARYRIPPYYDSMIAKLIVRGKDRREALLIANRALKEFHISGMETTLPFHLYMIKDQRFIDNDYAVTYVDKLIEEGCTFVDNKEFP